MIVWGALSTLVNLWEEQHSWRCVHLKVGMLPYALDWSSRTGQMELLDIMSIHKAHHTVCTWIPVLGECSYVKSGHTQVASSADKTQTESLAELGQKNCLSMNMISPHSTRHYYIPIRMRLEMRPHFKWEKGNHTDRKLEWLSAKWHPIPYFDQGWKGSGQRSCFIMGRKCNLGRSLSKFFLRE